jgi:hypothetical protein
MQQDHAAVADREKDAGDTLIESRANFPQSGLKLSHHRHADGPTILDGL